jgi:adenosylmethionine-8-amino-7-oxononanoate aminotransferase
MGERLLAGLQRMVDTHPTAGHARGAGLMCALDLVKSKETREPWGKTSAYVGRLNALLHERGVLVRILGDLLLAPPLIITAAQVDELLDVVDDSLTVAEREFGLR